ncbi:MAG: hypothetical protein WC783_00235 [Candidatus Paceibacterota bacterium]|jgi:hypothetical protein
MNKVKLKLTDYNSLKYYETIINRLDGFLKDNYVYNLTDTEILWIKDILKTNEFYNITIKEYEDILRTVLECYEKSGSTIQKPLSNIINLEYMQIRDEWLAYFDKKIKLIRKLKEIQ